MITSQVWSEQTPEPICVVGDRWRCELRGGEIAEITFDGSRLARAVRAVARDRDWNTVPTKIISAVESPSGCVLTLQIHGDGFELDGELTLIMNDNRCRIDFTATAAEELWTNRVGLVVLHPPELAGTALTVTTPGGAVSRSEFPVSIAPWQPAQDIARLDWIHDGVRTTATFTGEVFEMEDQRNWTDASYKTYSRPLAWQFPYRIGAGETIAQSVTFDAVRQRPRATSALPRVIELADAGRPVPEVTLGASSGPDAGAGSIPDGVSAVLVEVDTRDDAWPVVLGRAAAEAGSLPLDLRLIADDPARLDEAVRKAAATAQVVRLAVFSSDTHVTEPDLWIALRSAAGKLGLDADLVGGSRAHYTELNRTHDRLPADLPGLTFAITPQMHATDSRQLVESIGMQAVLLRDVGRIAAGRPVHVGPITLRPRFNDVATSDDGRLQRDRKAPDPRQAAPALEPWTVASFAAVCGAGDSVASVCYFEVAGARGLGTADRPFPVGSAVAAIAGLRGSVVRPVTPVPPGWWLVGGLAADGSLRLLAASLADDDHSATVRYAGRDHQLTLAPYQVADLTLA